MTNYMGIGDVATVEARGEKAQLCKIVNTTRVKQERFDSVTDVVDVGWIRGAAYALVGSFSSILSFRVVLPAALSVAPGLLLAAIRIKVVAPHSFLPGVFIVIMPLLYVPMIWSFTIFAIQHVSDPFLVVGITLVSFSPLANTILGVAKQVTSPMSRKGVGHFIVWVQRVKRFMQLVGGICILRYLAQVCVHIHRIQEHGRGIEAFILEQTQRLLVPLLFGQIDSLVSLIYSGPLWSFIFSFFAQMYLTAIVGSDWMLRASAEEWNSQGREYLVELEEQGCLDNMSAEMLHKQREAAMAAMLDLTTRRRKHKEGH